jgi:hypothetical protein
MKDPPGRGGFPAMTETTSSPRKICSIRGEEFAYTSGIATGLVPGESIPEFFWNHRPEDRSIGFEN